MEPLNIANISKETLDSVVSILKGGPSGLYLPGQGVITKDITQATGLVAYNLEAPSKLLVPVMTPLRNRIPRVGTGKGTASEWKVITALDTSRVDIFTAEGTKAATVNISVTPQSAGYRTISKGDNNSFQSQWAGKGFEDVKARNILRLLAHVMIMEEQAILGASAALPAVSAPAVTVADAAGAIPDGAGVNVICRAITNVGRGRKSAATGTGAMGGGGNAHIISASVPCVNGAVKYEWYVGAAGVEKLEATTRINSVKLTALAGTGAVVGADNHTDALAFNGILQQIMPAVTPSGAIVRTLATGTEGTGTALSLDDLETVLQSMWDTWRANPDLLTVSSAEAVKITKLVLAANGGPTLFVTADSGNIGRLTGGYRVTHFLNPITGKQIPIEVHPYLQPGTCFFSTFELPFPGGDITNVLDIETRQEYLQLDYPVVAPKWEYEVLVDETLRMFWPGGFGVVRNINGQ